MKSIKHLNLLGQRHQRYRNGSSGVNAQSRTGDVTSDENRTSIESNQAIADRASSRSSKPTFRQQRGIFDALAAADDDDNSSTPSDDDTIGQRPGAYRVYILGQDETSTTTDDLPYGNEGIGTAPTPSAISSHPVPNVLVDEEQAHHPNIPPGHMVEEDDMDNDIVPLETKTFNRKRLFLLLAFVLVGTLAVGVAVGVTTGGSSPNTVEVAVAASVSPTASTSPSMSPTTIEYGDLAVLSEFFGFDATPLLGSTELIVSQKLNGEIPSEIGILTKLTLLDLSENQLVGPVPPDLGMLTGLTRLNLGSNQLSSIPTELGALTVMTSIFLGSNKLTSIPSEIGMLTGLTELALDYNRLSSIPSELGVLTGLTKLDLYFNRLLSIPLSWES